MDHTPCKYWQLFQEENLKINWQENQYSSMVERQAKDLEVQVRIPVQVQSFLLIFNLFSTRGRVTGDKYIAP